MIVDFLINLYRRFNTRVVSASSVIAQYLPAINPVNPLVYVTHLIENHTPLSNFVGLDKTTNKQNPVYQEFINKYGELL